MFKDLDKYGHWEVSRGFDPTKYEGFVYLIICPDGRKYIGRKYFTSMRRVKVKGRKNRKITKTESDWKTYTSSSSTINKLIEDHGKEGFTFRILLLCENRADTNYYESKILMDARALERPDEYINRRVERVFCPKSGGLWSARRAGRLLS